ncbi:hypothetical protein GE107_25860, partial [Cohnella sp. CFH 77786]|uniref:phosphopantetheine-binding protein n=1 Tax=Cohnella sp. CFH 77786 TaxID=2662265 RepID=UPI001EBA1668
GRIDDQVKIRGYRIELGEIERTLLLHEAVSEAAVAARDDEAGGKRLVGYVVADRACTSGELRRHCAERLPAYMIPEAFVQLESMPLTASGKADRKALPEPEEEMATGTEYAAPENGTEMKLAALWAELLQRERVGVHDNFFELGGHSLLLVRMHKRLEQEFGRLLSVTDLFAYPSVAKLAEYLDRHNRTPKRSALVPLRVPGGWGPAERRPQAADYLKLTLAASTVRELRDIAEAERTEPALPALGIWVVLLARMFRQPRFDLPVAGFGQGIRVAEIDLNAARGFSELLERLRAFLSADAALPEFAAGASAGTDAIVPLYRNGLAGELPREWKGKTDLTIAVGTAGTAWTVEIEYDAGKIRREKLKELLQAFPMWCSRLAGEKQAREQPAAAQEKAAISGEDPG